MLAIRIRSIAGHDGTVGATLIATLLLAGCAGDRFAAADEEAPAFKARADASGSYHPVRNPMVDCWLSDGSRFLTAYSRCVDADGVPSVPKPDVVANGEASPKADMRRAPRATRTYVQAGTGFAVSADGHLVTNRHVVERCRSIIVRDQGIERSANLVVEDPANDLAVLRVAGLASHAFASFSGRRRVEAGETAIAIGFPLSGILALEASVTVGNVSALAGIGNDARFLQITTPVQPGNSGGPVIDAKGQVVGMVVSMLNSMAIAREMGSIPQNVNFAIKQDVLLRFLDTTSVGYQVSDDAVDKPAAQIAKVAKRFTYLVGCQA